MKGFLILLLFTSSVVIGQQSYFSTIHFKKADSIALVHKDASLNNLPILTHRLTSELNTEVEKFRAIYTWVCTNIENDYTSYLKTSKKRNKLANDREAFLEWNTGMTPRVFEKLRKERKTACTGYAYLLKEMATLAGLECEIINGYGRTATVRLTKDSAPNHSWNRVKLNDSWYLCDATWSAGRIILEDDGPKFESNYFDGYFLASPALFAKNHYPLEKVAFLLTDPPNFSQFLEGPIVYKEAFTYNMVPQHPEKMHISIHKNEKLELILKISDEFKNEKPILIVHNGIIEKRIAPIIIKNQDNYKLQFSLEKTGLFDVHIKVKEHYIATYVVRVKRN